MLFGTGALVDEGVVVVGAVRAAVGPAAEDGVLVLEDLALVRAPSLALSASDVSASALARASSVESCQGTPKKKIAVRPTATTRETITAITQNGDFQSARAPVLAS